MARDSSILRFASMVGDEDALIDVGRLVFVVCVRVCVFLSCPVLRCPGCQKKMDCSQG